MFTVAPVVLLLETVTAICQLNCCPTLIGPLPTRPLFKENTGGLQTQEPLLLAIP